jgi:hypothetical protein
MTFSFKKLVPTGILAPVLIALAGCTAMMTLPTDKLSEAAAMVTGKPIKAVTNVRSVGDTQLFDAQTADGKMYSCSLSVVMGMTYQHQKCEPK